MSKIIIILVFIFWAALSVFFVRSLFTQKNQSANNQANTTVDNKKIAEHSTASDCWVIYQNNVYDVTDYIASHPGGKQAIISYCGQDMTAAFDNMPKHGTQARDILNGLEIGVVTQAGSQNNINTNTNTNPVSPAPASYTLTKELVAQHNTASDCWVTAGNTVYNVTNYIYQHPGGSSRIIPYCGSDIQAAFDAQGHSANAANILAGLEIGVLGQAVSAQNTNPSAPVNNNNNNNDDEDEDEFEDD